jgi:hypothetical protein
MVRAALLVFALSSLAMATPAPQSETKAETKTGAKTPTTGKAASKPQTPMALDPAQTRLVFEPNQGQFASSVEWIARGSGFAVAIAADGVTIETHERTGNAQEAPLRSAPQAKGAGQKQARLAVPAIQFSTVKMHLDGGHVWKLEGAEPTGGISNYYLGKDAAKWRSNIPQYAQAKAAGVYDGVDLVFNGSQSELEYDFVVAPGADPKQIRLKFDGAANVHEESGALVMTTTTGKELRHAQPKIYQQSGGKKTSVKGGFQVQADGTATFQIGEYDRTKPLVIDPTILFVRFLAGSDTDTATGITYDPNGFTYVTGYTYSNNFPAFLGVQGYKGGADAFVTRLDASGNLAASTYLGGGDEDYGAAVAVDEGGIYVTGTTFSDDYPVMQPMQGSLKGGGNIFLTKLSLLGNVMVYSTYFGGSGADGAIAIAVDATQAVYLAGTTSSKDFPILGAGAYEDYPPKEDGDNISNGFVMKISPSGKTLVYATFLGGSNYDEIDGLAIDSTNAAYVTGGTCSVDFPYAGFQSQSWPDTCTAFITKLSPAGDAVIYSTMLGGNATYGRSIALDAADNAHVAGTKYIFQDKTTEARAFVAEVNATGKLMYLKNFNGSSGNSSAQAVAADAAGDTWVGGGTSSSDFPGAPHLTPNPSAGFLMKLDPSGNGPVYTVLLGAGVTGVAVQIPRRIGPIPTYPQIYTCGARYFGGVEAQDQHAFVVKLSEAPAVVVENN